MVNVASAHTSDGIRVAFEEHGRGRAVVLLHGLCESRRSWEPVWSQLGDEFRCIALDFRGHGDSARLAHYEPGGFIADVAAVIEATCDEPPLVIGHSLGGVVATVAGALNMTGPVLSIDQPLKQGPFAQLVHSLATRLRDPSSFGDALMEEKTALGMGLVPEPTFTELEHLARTCHQSVVLDTWAPMLDGDERSLESLDEATCNVVSTLRTPLLALHGGPLEAGYDEWFQHLLPHAELEIWPGLGHWLHLVDTPRFVDQFKAFAAAS